MRTRDQQYSVGVSSNDKQWTEEGTSSRSAAAATDSNTPADDWKSRFRPLAFDPPTEGQGQGQEEVARSGVGAVAGSVSSSEWRQRRQHQRASGGRWRASLELIDSARARGVGVGIGDSDMDSDMDGDDAEAEAVRKRAEKGGSWGGLGESVEAPVNYALLIHSCLLLSLSTYNLKVNYRM